MTQQEGCIQGCVCSCGQQGCGCHLVAKPAPAPTITGPAATCEGCDQPAPIRRFKSPGGQVVVVLLCPRCDRDGSST